ncbi:IS701 family transposase [Sporosarcina sp. FSL K6-3457]|uniref:IS701 family transposase n=1 Tax=Sporosarcina sp. FSL K6-3457 TaxID=2978204 RepID=UPI0030FC315D
MSSLSHHQQIEEGFQTWNLPFYFSKPVVRHLLHFIDGMSSIGFTGKLTEIHALSHHAKHRTTLGHFLQHSPWNESFLLRQSKKHVLRNMKKDEPTFLLLDDTISQKTKPSSQATSPIQATGFHFSHTDGKSVWGHQVVQLMMANQQTAFPFDFRLFCKEQDQSKIDLSLEMIRQVPTFNHPTYLLCDSWYTSKTIIEAAFCKGIHTIGAMKTNRILYPKGIRIQAKQFATHIQPTETNFVTIGQETYRVYRYEGALNDLANGIVLLCWPSDDETLDPKNMRCFLSTDVELTNEQILTYYGYRWRIETYFQQVKGHLGFQGYQVRSRKAIQRFWILVQFAYLFLSDIYGKSFTQTIHLVRKNKFASIIEFVHNSTKHGASLEQIKNELQVA